MSEWKEIALDGLPMLGEQVVLADVETRKSFDPFGCHKDVGVLMDDYGNGPYWSTQGQLRSMTLKAFTHWMPISEPQA